MNFPRNLVVPVTCCCRSSCGTTLLPVIADVLPVAVPVGAQVFLQFVGVHYYLKYVADNHFNIVQKTYCTPSFKILSSW